MSSLAQKLGGYGARAAIPMALLLLSSPLAAQKTKLTLSGATLLFPAPTATDFINGYVNSGGGVTYTVNAITGTSRTTTISIRSASADLGGGKAIGDLQWRRSDLATWNSITLTDAQVEQKIQIHNALNDPWSNTIFFRMILSWTKDAPATYSGSYVVTLSQTVP